MSEWALLLLATLVAASIVLIPGWLATSALGLVGSWRLGLAAPAGVSTVAIAATIAGAIGLSWSIVPVIIVTIVIVGICWLTGRLLRSKETLVRKEIITNRSHYYVAVAVAAMVLLAQFIYVIGAPSNISQTFDNVFHLNGIRYALETQNASPLWMGTMTSASSGGVPFYPSAWHALGSLIVQITGVSIPIASNALLLVFATIVWPMSVLLLAQVFVPKSVAAMTAAVAAAAGIPAFPLLMADYGVLYPYLLGLSLVPAVLAALIGCVNGPFQKARVTVAVILLGSIPGIGVAHPGAFVALLVFATVVLGVAFIRFLTSGVRGRTRAWAFAAAAVYLVVGGLAWYVLRPPAEARTWGPTESMGQALGEVLAVSPGTNPVNIAIAVLVAVGAVVAIRRRSFTDIILLVMFGVAAGLYVVVSGLPYWTPRDILTGAWYNNAPRLAALLPIVWVPLTALGGHAAWQWVSGRLKKRETSKGVSIAVAALLAISVIVLPQVTSMREATSWARGTYTFSDESPLLTSEELALIERIPDHVPEDVRIAGSSWTGAGLAYALVDRPVLMPHTLMDITPDIELILDGLDEATPNSDVCAAVERENVGFVLDFGSQEINNESHPYEGLDRLNRSDAVELVDSEGDVNLYRVVACDPQQ